MCCFEFVSADSRYQAPESTATFYWCVYTAIEATTHYQTATACRELCSEITLLRSQKLWERNKVRKFFRAAPPWKVQADQSIASWQVDAILVYVGRSMSNWAHLNSTQHLGCVIGHAVLVYTSNVSDYIQTCMVSLVKTCQIHSDLQLSNTVPWLCVHGSPEKVSKESFPIIFQSVFMRFITGTRKKVPFWWLMIDLSV